MRPAFYLVIAAMMLGTVLASAAETIGGDKAFSFVALGDVPYNVPGDYAKFDRLITAVNAMKPAFTLHMGDTKSGKSPCSDELLKKAYDQLQTFEGALVYTIGDNEWLDCHRKEAGGFDPRERLAKVREMFFATPQKSLGRTPIDVETQARLMPDFAAHVENTRFAKNDVLFLGVHVPGSNNGFEADDPEAAKEFFARDRANVAWINAGFAMAKDSGKSNGHFHASGIRPIAISERWDAATIRVPPYAGCDREGREDVWKACPAYPWR
jgi:hypothetical protein